MRNNVKVIRHRLFRLPARTISNSNCAIDRPDLPFSPKGEAHVSVVETRESPAVTHTSVAATMGLRKRLELRSESADLGTEGGRLSNKDMDPIPMGSPERTWGWPSLLGFWIAEAFSISMYQGRCSHSLMLGYNLVTRNGC